MLLHARCLNWGGGGVGGGGGEGWGIMGGVEAFLTLCALLLGHRI